MSIKLNGATSGSVELDVPDAIGSDLNVTIPATAGDIVVKGTDGSVDLGAIGIDSSGNVGIGTTSPAGKLTLKTTNANGAPTGWDASYFVISEGDTGTSFGLGLSLDTTNNEAHISSLIPGTQWQPINYRASQHKFFITDAASNEAMRIDSSGNLMVNRSTVNNVGKISFDFYGQTENGIVLKSTWTGSSASFAVFRNSSNNLCGSITQNGTTSVNYSSASDYRLKENVVEITNGITRVKQLSPKRFNFIADKNRTVDGFLAHEAQTVVPEAVTGEKDGEKMQSIDQSKLVPLLTAALQEAIAKIENLEASNAALETRLTALEGGS